MKEAVNVCKLVHNTGVIVKKCCDLFYNRRKGGVKESESTCDMMTAGLNGLWVTIKLHHSVNTISLCPRDPVKECGHMCPCTWVQAVHDMLFLSVIFSPLLSAVEGRLTMQPCQQQTCCTALRCAADMFTCSQRYTFTPAGLAVTLLADDGAHRIP